jgi:tetratricopeptide (TPR) repeat protein
MADDLNNAAGKPGGSGEGARSPGKERLAKESMPEVPPSRPLQWFLLGALVISGAAYVVGQWTDRTASQTKVHYETKLRRLVQGQSDYLAHCKAGNEAFAGKNYDLAVSEYRLALEGQDNPLGHEYLGQALLKQGNPDAAFAQFQEALRLNPRLVDVSSAWGLALAAEGKPEEAARVFQDALQRDPDSGLLHYNLATALLLMRADAESRRREDAAAGKPQEAQVAEANTLAEDALRHFAKASRNGIDSAEFWCVYGRLLNQLGRYAEAEPCLVRAASEDASMAAAQFQLAAAEDHLGKYAEAIAHYEKALTLTPDDPATLNNLALLYATASNPEVRSPKMAVQLAVRACDATINQMARYMDTLARGYAADGDFFQAITWEDKAVHRAAQLNDQELARELQARYALFLEHKKEGK